MCTFKHGATSRGESVGTNATQMNSGIQLQQHSQSSGSHVSWRASKATRASLSESELTLNCLHQLLRRHRTELAATTNATFAHYHCAFFRGEVSSVRGCCCSHRLRNMGPSLTTVRMLRGSAISKLALHSDWFHLFAAASEHSST